MDNHCQVSVHEKSVEILSEVGFCVPEQDALARLETAGFPVDWESQMVRVTPELLETALAHLPRNVRLYDRAGERSAPFERYSCFMDAGTPVNVLDLEIGMRRPAIRRDVRNLVILQDALPQVDIVRLVWGNHRLGDGLLRTRVADPGGHRRLGWPAGTRTAARREANWRSWRWDGWRMS
jgi:trimethylamine:corrinoid methyltransferase-like protein